MKTPLSLRLALAWAILRGEFFSISVITNESGTAYTFVVGPQSVRQWVEKSRQRRAARRAEKGAGR